jgi:uncharacterized protein (DUF924 family)
MDQNKPISPAEVIAFWTEAGAKRWFGKDEAFDTQIRERFLATHEAAAAGELADWERAPEGSLALLLLLDQFPRNMFRGSRRSYTTDPQALALAERAIARGDDKRVPKELRTFFYLPHQHVEDLAMQKRGVALYQDAGDPDGLKWAELHADIIRRFGRFPHRNPILGRSTTPDEQAFLDSGGFAG